MVKGHLPLVTMFKRAFVEIKMLKGPLLFYVLRRAFIKFKLLKGPTLQTFD